MDDFDLSGYPDWSELCQNPDDFSGAFDGNHFRHYGLTMTASGNNNRGLFSRSAVGSVIKNTHLRTTNLSINGTQSGTLCGYASGSIQDCSSTGTLSTTQIVTGGMVGYLAGAMSGCWARVNITSTQSWVGGMVGSLTGTITSSWTEGAVVGGWATGGLVGNTGGGAVAITSSYSLGATGGVGGDDVGGLVGLLDTGSITDSYATGNVSSNDVMGGLVGEIRTSGSILRSYATGDLSSAVGGSMSGNGGLVGGIGFGGPAVVATIDQSFATGDVNAEMRVSGLVGSVTAISTLTITDSYSTGAVMVNIGGGGGLVGDVTGTLTINSSYSRSALLGAGGNGVSPGGTVNNSYWDTDATAASATGTGLTNLQMQSAGNFVGFTFDATHWVMGTYPRLYWE